MHAMDKQSFPTLDQDRWTLSEKLAEDRIDAQLEAVDFHSAIAAPFIEHAAASGMPVSSIMKICLWTVHAEDTIEKVEQILSEHALSSAPVLGSDGAIVGMIGTQELVLFHSLEKNSKVVRAWEISLCKNFEVNPGDSVEDVARLMAEHKIDHIAVTQMGSLQGVVSVQDVMQVIMTKNTDQASAREVK